MITDFKALHMLGVARKCYNIAEERGFDEEFCKRMWLIGWLHDIGSEFVKGESEVSSLSSEMCKFIGAKSTFEYDEVVIDAIKNHKKIMKSGSNEWEILAIANLSVSSDGYDVGVTERLKNLKLRYGTDSERYQNSEALALHLGLITEADFA